MAGDVSTLRLAGMPSGYPAEIDATLKVRFVDNLLINMSENSTDLLKYFGGFDTFVFTNPKIEWVEDDIFGRRPTHTGLAAAGTTSLTVTAQAHNYPVGTLLLHVSDGEIVRVAAIVDDNTLTLTRDYNSAVSEGAWASTDEVIVCGHVMSEDDNWTYRPSATLSMPYNYGHVTHTAFQASYRRLATQFYGLVGTDLDYQSARATSFHFVAFEQQLIKGARYVGADALHPATMGGIDFFVTSANGAYVNDLGSNTVPVVRRDFDDALQDRWYTVGPENMGMTLIGSVWAQRRIDSFWTNAERISSGATMAGTAIRTMHTVFGDLDISMHTAVAKDDIYLTKRDSISMGHYAGLGRPHLIALPAPSATGPRVQRAFYGDVSAKVKGVQAMARINGFALS